jgi:hypothetical protein
VVIEQEPAVETGVLKFALDGFKVHGSPAGARRPSGSSASPALSRHTLARCLMSSGVMAWDDGVALDTVPFTVSGRRTRCRRKPPSWPRAAAQWPAMSA